GDDAEDDTADEPLHRLVGGQSRGERTTAEATAHEIGADVDHGGDQPDHDHVGHRMLGPAEGHDERQQAHPHHPEHSDGGVLQRVSAGHERVHPLYLHRDEYRHYGDCGDSRALDDHSQGYDD